MHFWIQAALLLSLLSIVCCQKLLMIQETFRHGARYPIYPSKKDQSMFALEQHSVGELTSQGKNMHYILGKIIYRTYWDALFAGTPYQNRYNQSQFYVKSTNYNRTIESAQSHLFGLLEDLPPLQLTPSEYNLSQPAWEGEEEADDNVTSAWQVFKAGPAFHPIPIHVQNLGSNEYDEGDFLAAYSFSNCPNQKFWTRENWEKPEAQEIENNEQVKAAVKALSKQIGLKIKTKDVISWMDTKIAEQYLGMPYLPVFDDPLHKKYFQFLYSVSLYLEAYFQEDQIRAVASSYMKRTLRNIEGKIKGEFTPRIVIYSAHDTTVGMILAALNMTNVACISDHYLDGIKNADTCVYEFPQFTSNVIFELWEDGSDHYIKILYNGIPRKIPICGNKVKCPVHQFKAWVKKFEVKDFIKACGIADRHSSYIVAIVFLSITIVALTAAIFYMRLRKIKPTNEVKGGYEVYMEEQLPEEKNSPPK